MHPDSTPQTNDLTGLTQSTEDARLERLMVDLHAVYHDTPIPQRLAQMGAAQTRAHLASSARREPLGFLGFAHRWRASLASGWALLTGQGALATLATLALIGLLATLLLSRPGFISGSPASWGHRGPPSPAPMPPGPPVTLVSVAMVSASDGWAFGGSQKRGCLVLHYTGASWSQDKASACAPATSISMVSADDGWAVAYRTILRYSQGKWRIDTIYPPDQDPSLNRIAMVSTSEGWIVGTANTPAGIPNAFILHYAHGHWAPVRALGLNSAQASSLRGIAMVSASEGWAVGSIFGPDGENTLVLHYLNGRWTPIPWSIVGSFNSVAAFPSGDLWAVGEVNPAAGPGLIVHLRNGAVVQEVRPIPGLMQDIAMVSPTDGWAVGDGAATVRYQNGTWTREGLTIHQYSLASVTLTSANDGWAVGYTNVEPSPYKNAYATLFHLSGGVWTAYPLTGM